MPVPHNATDKSMHTQTTCQTSADKSDYRLQINGPLSAVHLALEISPGMTAAFHCRMEH